MPGGAVCVQLWFSRKNARDFPRNTRDVPTKVCWLKTDPFGLPNQVI
jgi:hypothetical protein